MFRAIVVLIALTVAAPVAAQDSARIGAVNLSYVARSSKIGKTEIARIEDATRKKSGELDVKAAELQQRQAELQKTGVGLSARAVADLQRAFDKSRLDFERLQQDARNDIEAMRTQFNIQFRAKLEPVIDAICKEKGLHFVFSIEDAPLVVWWSPGVDISEEVVKRLDAAK